MRRSGDGNPEQRDLIDGDIRPFEPDFERLDFVVVSVGGLSDVGTAWVLMEALFKLVAERAGIDERPALKTIAVVIEQLKDKLPGPIADQVEDLVSGDGGDGAAEALGGMGKKLGF